MTKPVRGSPQLPAVPPIRKDYMEVNLAAHLLAMGTPVAKAAKKLSVSDAKVRTLFADPQIIAIADELSTDLKEQFSERNTVFVQKIFSDWERHYSKYESQVIPALEKLAFLMDSAESESLQASCADKILNRYGELTKAITGSKESTAGALTAISVIRLMELVAQDTGKMIDVTPSNGAAQEQ